MATSHRDVLREWRECETEFAAFNRRLGMRIASLLGSMGFFWACVTLDVLAIPGVVLLIMQTLGVKLPAWAVPVSVMVTLVSFLSQTVIQLLALPVLQYSGNLAQQAADARSEATFRNSVDAERMLKALLDAHKLPVPDGVELTD